jgi:hypothetical protein
MNDAKKVYAIGSGIVALILVLALAIVVLATNQPTTTAKKVATPTTTQRQVHTPSNNQVRSVVRTPDSNTVTQSVTVRR